MAPIADPQGGVSPCSTPEGEMPLAEGTFVWDELVANDVEAAKQFYGEVLRLDEPARCRASSAHTRSSRARAVPTQAASWAAHRTCRLARRSGSSTSGRPTSTRAMRAAKELGATIDAGAVRRPDGRSPGVRHRPDRRRLRPLPAERVIGAENCRLPAREACASRPPRLLGVMRQRIARFLVRVPGFRGVYLKALLRTLDRTPPSKLPPELRQLKQMLGQVPPASAPRLPQVGREGRAAEAGGAQS